MNGEEKGALLLKSLAPEVAQAILTQLGPERSKRMRGLMDRISPGPQMQHALQEMNQEIQEALRPKKIDIVEKAEPSEPTKAQPPQDYLKTLEGGGDPLDLLKRLPPERLALALEGENPRTVSLLLSYLDTGLAGDLYKRLSAKLRNDVTVQFSSQVAPRLEVLQHIARAVLHKTCTLEEKPAFPDGPARFQKMADMLRGLSKPERLPVLAALEERDAAAAVEVKNFLYRFEDVLRIDKRSMQKLLVELDTKNLALALKDAAAEVRDKFMASLSKRAQETLGEEMELLQAVQEETVAAARKEIVTLIQKLDLAGELVMSS